MPYRCRYFRYPPRRVAGVGRVGPFVSPGAFETGGPTREYFAGTFPQQGAQRYTDVVQPDPHAHVGQEPADGFQVQSRHRLQFVNADKSVHSLAVGQQPVDLYGREQQQFGKGLRRGAVQVEGVARVVLQPGQHFVKVERPAVLGLLGDDVFDELLGGSLRA